MDVPNGNTEEFREGTRVIDKLRADMATAGLLLPQVATVDGQIPDDGGTTSTSPGTDEGSAEPETEQIAASRPEIVEGLIREGQIVALGGAYAVGKSPMLHNLIACRALGVPCCGRTLRQGPSILLDFENPEAIVKRNIINVCRRYGRPPVIPDGIEILAEHGDPATNPNTRKLLDLIQTGRTVEKVAFLEEALQRLPDALVVIDPMELFFMFDTREKLHILAIYGQYRLLLSKYPRAAIANTFNLRKRDRRGISPDLLLDPRSWLEEICGSLDLLNRSDVRLGMSFYGEDGARVVNGIRRGEQMHPSLIQPIFLDDELDQPAGFERLPAGAFDILLAFTTKQLEYWKALPTEFTFKQAIDLMGKANFHRLAERATVLGLLKQIRPGLYRKVAR